MKSQVSKILAIEIKIKYRLFIDFENWPGGYKTFFMLNPVEYEILNAHKYENIKKFSIF